MCQICGMNTLSYANQVGAASAVGGETGWTASSNQSPQWGGSGGNFRVTQTATSNTNIDGVLSGSKWGGGTLTYSFPTLATQYEAAYAVPDAFGQAETANGFFAAPAATQTAIRFAMNMVSQFTNLATSEVSGSTAADVRVAFSSDANPTAYAYYPSDSTKGGDIWFGNNYASYQNPIKGQYAWATVIHELGHSLGLKHGHETGGVSNTAMQSQFDQMAYSIMTYKSYQNGPTTGYTNELNGYAQTFMMYDIAALQTMYGANFNTNSGNTTYTWNSTTGEMSIDGVGQGAPGGNRIFMTLWDGNGIDHYNFSNYTTNLTVNLAPGSFSITSSTQLANLGNSNIAPGNIFNALQFNGDIRSLIENATGGSGNDNITGNAADNVLNGGGGNDQLYGGLGADYLNGETGFDLARYDGAVSGVTARLDYSSLNLGEAFGDTYLSIEGIVGSSHADFLVGDSAANYLNGSFGDDYLAGNDNSDTLIGDAGNDNLWGGLGSDQLDGGTGYDVARYDFAATGVVARLDGATNSGEASGDVYINIEALYGSAFGDYLIGNGANNVLAGLDGNDLLYGLGGDDYLLGGAGADAFAFNAAGFGNDVVADFATSNTAGAQHDFIDFRGLSLSLFSITQSGADTLITTNAGTIRLIGIDGTTLLGSDFLF